MKCFKINAESSKEEGVLIMSYFLHPSVALSHPSGCSNTLTSDFPGLSYLEVQMSL